MWFSTCCHCSLWKINGCCFPCVVTSHLISSAWISMLSLMFNYTVDVVFHMLSLPSLKNQWMEFSLCCQAIFSKQWMWFFTSCHCSLSKNNRCCFPCIVTSHLRESGWISIFCHCCFTKQWMWFSTCCHCPFSKCNGFRFPCVFSSHLISSRWFSMLSL